MTKPKTETITTADDDRPHEKQVAGLYISPSFTGAIGAVLVANGTQDGRPDLGCYVDELSRQIERVYSGDLGRAEAMLITQAHTLDGLFTKLMRRSFSNMGEHLDEAERFMRLALKAQNQCQSTLRTLGELKTPKQLAFISQANVSNGPQQVNNVMEARAVESQNRQNKQLEQKQNEWLDTRTQSQTGGTDKELAAVEAVNRAKD